jgi:hypothetical protein
VSRLSVGRWTVDAGLLRSLATLGAGLALGGGLVLGVASANPTAAAVGPDVTPVAPSATPQAAVPQRPAVRRPLHQLLLARLRGDASPTPLQGRIVAGRLVELTGNVATIQTGPNQTRQVRVMPQTRLPARRPRPGDQVLAIGQPARDGVLNARAIAVRPAPPSPASGRA